MKRDDFYSFTRFPTRSCCSSTAARSRRDPRTIQRIPLTLTAQVRMCGNSVSPLQAEALVRANFTHEAAIYGRAA